MLSPFNKINSHFYEKKTTTKINKQINPSHTPFLETWHTNQISRKCIFSGHVKKWTDEWHYYIKTKCKIVNSIYNSNFTMKAAYMYLSWSMQRMLNLQGIFLYMIFSHKNYKAVDILSMNLDFYSFKRAISCHSKSLYLGKGAICMSLAYNVESKFNQHWQVVIMMNQYWFNVDYVKYPVGWHVRSCKI